jgi:hypothetical protein
MGERSSVIAQIRDTVCEAVAVTSSDDKRWITIHRIHKYFEDYSEIDRKKVERNLLTALKDLEKQQILVRKKNSFTFRAMETIEDGKKGEKVKEKRKVEEPKEKKLGPDVVLTSSGRVSIVRH